MQRPLLGVLALLLSACSPTASDPNGEQQGGGGYVECVVPRPEVCKHDYLPVCGLRDTGIRCVTEPCDSWETKTYSNACTSCADPDVYGWRPRECEREGIVRNE